MLREAVAQYVVREERDVFRQDTIKAREEFKSCRLHATAGEADARPARWSLTVAISIIVLILMRLDVKKEVQQT